MICNVSMKIQRLLENEQAAQVLQNALPGLKNIRRQMQSPGETTGYLCCT